MRDNSQIVATRILLLTAVLACAASRAFAQTPDPVAASRLRFGPIGITPRISLTNAGIDTNVFNAPNDGTAQKDFTATLQPRLDLAMHVSRSVLTASVSKDFVYYKTFASERTVNSSYRAGARVPLNRLTFNGEVTHLNSRERPGFEIDARSQRFEHGYNGSIELRAAPKTFIQFSASHSNVEFSKDAVFLGASLQDELNRTATSSTLAIRYALTPLTNVTFDVTRQADRFQYSPLRDSDSTHTRIGFKFDPYAMLKGTAALGIRSFQPRVAGVPGYTGPTAAADLSYVVFTATKLSVQLDRDVQYSFSIDQPFYVLSGTTISLWRQIYGQLDAVGRLGRQRLDYRDRAGAVLEVANRQDHVRSYGGGLSYRLGWDVRLGLNIDWVQRTSGVRGRSYNDVKIGTAFTYGQ